MKCSNNFLTFLVMFLSISLLFSVSRLRAQELENSQQVKIKITRTENGETQTLEKNFQTNEREEIERLLEEYAIEIDPDAFIEDEEVEIVIRKKKVGGTDKEVIIDIDRLENNVIVEKRAFLGVYFEQLYEDDIKDKGIRSDKGIMITGVVEGSEAQNIGLEIGDVITKVGDREIVNKRNFIEAIRSYNPNEEVEIIYYREGIQKSARAVLGEKETVSRPHSISGGNYSWQPRHHGIHEGVHPFGKQPFLGIAGDPTSEVEGVEIEEVMAGTTADKAGLEKGDAIYKINGQKVSTLEELRNELRKIEPGNVVEIEYMRDGVVQTAEAVLKTMAEYHAAKHGTVNKERCLEKYNAQYMDTEIDKEQLKQKIESEIQMLEKKLRILERELDEAKAETDEVEIIITIEDISGKEAAGMNMANKSAVSSENALPIEELSFSPNPNNGRFNLNFYLPDKGKTTIRIFDINNKEIYNETLGRFSGSFNNQIDISDNSKGVYFLHISQNDKSFNKKIIIQ